MSKVNWKGGALLAPVPPVMVSCGDMDKPNIITIGWTGILNTIPPKTYISIRPSRHSYGLIKERESFVINLTTESLVRACDYCGVKSGKEIDKFAEMKLTAIPSPNLNCPMIEEAPVSIECRLTGIQELGSHDMFLADIVGVSVNSELLSKEGRLQLEKAKLVAYAHGEYFSLGDKLGSFGFSVRKKQIKRKGAKTNGRKHNKKI